MCSEGKPVTGPMIIEKANAFYDQIKITDKAVLLGSNNRGKKFHQYWNFLIIWNIWHLSGPLGARLKEFYLT
jgi:hypothetical protein